jgi:hypothetical protein
MNGTPQQGFGARAMRTLTRLVMTLLLLAMAGAVAFLLSELNARTFTLAVEGGQLVVMKGRMLPWGAVPYRPSDAGQADTYAPIPLEGHEVPQSLLTQRFTERDELDRALFSQLEALARPRIASDEPQKVERGVYYLRRAERLTGLGDEQRLALKQMQGEVAYYQARQKMDDARKLLTEALGQLRLAAESDNRHARSAHQMLTEVEPAAVALEDALRKAVHTLSAPPSQEAAPPAPGAPSPSPGPSPGSPGANPQGRDGGSRGP